MLRTKIFMMLAALMVAEPLLAQECPDLPPVPPLELKECKGLTKPICVLGNEGRKNDWNRLNRNFTSSLNIRSTDDKPVRATVDSIRGCKGETINLVIDPGNASFVEYKLSAPNEVVLLEGTHNNWRGERIIAKAVTLPQSGYFTLKTWTSVPPRAEQRKNRQGYVETYYSYPRNLAVSFKSDASTSAMRVGEKAEATVDANQPFIRRVAVTGGSKVRFRFASMGTGNFIATVLRENGEQLHRTVAPAQFDEVLAVTPTSDETFNIRVSPAGGSQSLGLTFSVIDDKAAGTVIAMNGRAQSAFKLPAQYDYEMNPAHKSIYATEAAKLQYQTAGPERIGLVVRPSGATGLTMRVKVFDEATEDVIVDERISKPSTVLVNMNRAGTWIIALYPVSAAEMLQAGEARYTVEVMPAPAAAAPAKATPARPNPAATPRATRPGGARPPLQ